MYGEVTVVPAGGGGGGAHDGTFDSQFSPVIDGWPAVYTKGGDGMYSGNVEPSSGGTLGEAGRNGDPSKVVTDTTGGHQDGGGQGGGGGGGTIGEPGGKLSGSAVLDVAETSEEPFVKIELLTVPYEEFVSTFVVVGLVHHDSYSLAITDDGFTMKQLPFTSYVNDVASGNDVFVATSSTDIAYSSNGKNWQLATLPEGSFGSFRRVVFGNDKFIIVTDSAYALVSTNGKDWSSEYTNVDLYDQIFLDAAFGNGTSVLSCHKYGSTKKVFYHREDFDSYEWKSYEFAQGYVPYHVGYLPGTGRFVMTTRDFKTFYSTDGVNWSESGPPSMSTGPIAYGNEKLFGIHKDQTIYDVSYSLDDGVTWNAKSVSTPFETGDNYLTYGDGKFVVAPYRYGEYLKWTSTGIEFEQKTLGLNFEDATWQSRGIAYKKVSTLDGTNKFVAVGRGIGAYSIYGVNWIEASTIPQSDWRGINYGNGKFVVVSSMSSAAVSTNGVNWTYTTLPQGDWRSVTYGNGKFVAVGYANTNAYSINGINWISTAMRGYDLIDVVYGSDKFVAIGDLEKYYSIDGVNWTLITYTNCIYKSIIYKNGMFVIVGIDHENDMPIIEYSTNGINWTTVTTPPGDLKSITYGNGKFVAVGNNSAIYSTNGIDWVATTMPIGDWYGVAYGNDKFVAIRFDYNYIAIAAYSTNGIDWYETPTIPRGIWYDVTYGE